MDDASLATAAQQGDRQAFAAIYDRYADRIHDFCHAALRNRDDAAEVTADTFLLAYQRIGQLREPSHLRPWLYAIARNASMHRSQRRARTTPDDDMTDIVDTSAEAPDRALEREEAGRLVWHAAEALPDRDRVLLDLHLRQGLDGQSLAEAMEVEPSHVYVLVNRAKEKLSRSIGALVLARYGRRDCPVLAGLLARWDGTLSPTLRKRIVRHADICDQCDGARKNLLAPAALYSLAPIVGAPIALRAHALDNVMAAPADPPTGPQPSPPTSTRHTPARAPVIAGAVVIVILLLVAVGVRRATSDIALDGSDPLAAAAPSTTPGRPGSPRGGTLDLDPAHGYASSTTNAAAPSEGGRGPGGSTGGQVGGGRSSAGGLTTDPQSIDFGDTASSATITIHNGDAAAANWTATAATTGLSVAPSSGTIADGATVAILAKLDRSAAADGVLHADIVVRAGDQRLTVPVTGRVDRAPSIASAKATASNIGAAACTGPTGDRTAITVSASDAGGVSGVQLIWSGAASGSAALSEQGGSWRGVLGPFSFADDHPGAEWHLTWSVRVTDNTGHTSTSSPSTLTVSSCKIL